MALSKASLLSLPLVVVIGSCDGGGKATSIKSSIKTF